MSSLNRPLPDTQLHYADPSINDQAQSLAIIPLIDKIHYPTLGCPALLGPGQSLIVILSLPHGKSPRSDSISLHDRHGDGGILQLTLFNAPIPLEAPAPQGSTRVLWRLEADLSQVPPKLYDLCIQSAQGTETQFNAVRVYAEITGKEKVVFCGDAQFHEDNAQCLERFIDKINARGDIAWIAMIGDVCDNAVRSSFNIVRLAASAKPGPVHSYYHRDYAEAAKRLSKLNKPIVLMAGNHDGMAAYENYSEGEDSQIYLGPDPKNKVAYDGFHHFRRTLGPLYFAFDWSKTRYLCTNTFELDRHQRLGYHAIVANWGGWMRDEQYHWLISELQDASANGLHKVVMMHHDPRGGSEGSNLGYFHNYRSYNLNSLGDIVLSYLRYVGRVAFTRIGWQQEWMRWPNQPLSEHPVKKLLAALLEQRVWAVVMGHDNENWMESYCEGDGIFSTEPQVQKFSADASAVDANLVRDIADLLDSGEIGEVVKMLEQTGEEQAEDALESAVSRLDAQGKFKRAFDYAPDEISAWNLRAKASIHFAHVDDIGEYKHTRESHFKAYGYAVAELDEGRPIMLQHFDLLDETPGSKLPLEEL